MATPPDPVLDLGEGWHSFLNSLPRRRWVSTSQKVEIQTRSLHVLYSRLSRSHIETGTGNKQTFFVLWCYEQEAGSLYSHWLLRRNAFKSSLPLLRVLPIHLFSFCGNFHILVCIQKEKITELITETSGKTLHMRMQTLTVFIGNGPYRHYQALRRFYNTAHLRF